MKDRIPILWNIMFNNIDKLLQAAPSPDILTDAAIDQELINDLMTSLQLIEVAAPHIHKDLHNALFELLPKLGILLTHPFKAVGYFKYRQTVLY